MMAHLTNLENDVQKFDRTSEKDHTLLARNIQEHLGRLVTNCTMEGKAHDELHKWLMPFLAVTTAYSDASAPPVREEKLHEIKDSLQTFHAYFE